MSAPASPVPTAAPANSADSADTQAPPPGSTDIGAADSTPFAKVLGHQIKGTKSDDGKAEPKAEAVLLPTGDDRTAAPPADALAIIASMLPGVAAQPSTERDTPNADITEGVGIKRDDRGGKDNTDDIAGQILAAPVPAEYQFVAAPAGKSGKEPVAEAILPNESKAKVIQTAIVAADTTKADTTATTGGAWKEEAGKFDALLDAATQAQSVAANSAPHGTANATDTRPSAASQVLTVATPVGASGWDNEVGEKLSWMVGRKETHAELVLNPPQLGRVEVSLSISGDQASATFVSASPEVRSALENAIPHLRETLQSAGISLGQTQVGSESFQQAANQRENGDNSTRGNKGHDADNTGTLGATTGGQASTSQWLRRGVGMVDTFA